MWSRRAVNRQWAKLYTETYIIRRNNPEPIVLSTLNRPRWQKVALAGLAVAGMAGAGFLTWTVTPRIKALDSKLAANVLSYDTERVLLGDTYERYTRKVRERLFETFSIVSGGLAVTAGCTVLSFRSTRIMSLFTKYPTAMGLAVSISSIAAMIACRQIPTNSEYQFLKGPLYYTFSGLLGVSCLGLCSVGGRHLLQAAILTSGATFGASWAAMVAPSDKFLTWGAPLFAVLCGTVFLSAGTLFMPVSVASAVDTGLMFVCTGLFSAYLVYDVQTLAARAKTETDNNFDPYRSAINIYLDIVNLYTNISQIIAKYNK